MSERHTHASAHGRPKWPVRAMVTCALLTAVSVVLARFLIPTPNEVTRFSLEAVPIFLAGMLFGPLPGALTGFAADFIGCLFSPYGYNPIFCVPPILYGLCAGLFRPWLTRRCSPLRLAAARKPRTFSPGWRPAACSLPLPACWTCWWCGFCSVPALCGPWACRRCSRKEMIYSEH